MDVGTLFVQVKNIIWPLEISSNVVEVRLSPQELTSPRLCATRRGSWDPGADGRPGG